MAIVREHDLHQRRRRRNAILGLVLAAFVVMVFGITLVKLQTARDAMADADAPRPAQVEAEQ